MASKNFPHTSPASKLGAPRHFFRRWLGATAVVVPALWGGSGCSSSDGEPGANTGGAVSSGGASTGGTTGGTGGTSGMTGGAASGGGSTGGSSTGGSSAGGSSTGGSDGTATGGAPATGGMDGTGASDTGGTDNGGTGGVAPGGTGGEGAGTGGGGSDDRLSPGCGTAFQSPPPDGQQQTMEIEGDTRYYLMDVPDDADNQTPLMLVFGLHGFDMNNIAVVPLFNFTQRSGGQAITVWPQGEGPHPGDVEHWGDEVLLSTWVPNEKNFAFLRQLMTDLGERYCIDQERIFIAGFSMGGYFTNSIACEHSDWFRGFAPVAGGGPQACSNADAQSAIMIQHGTEDDIVAISNGEGSRDFWQDRNGCGTGSSSSLNNCSFYEGCPDDKPVAWCTGTYKHYIPDEVASNIWSFFTSL